MPHLAHLGDSVDATSAVRDRNQIGRARNIIIPKIVMNDLEMPDALAGVRSEGQDAIRKEILADTVSAIMIVGRRASAGENQAALNIQGQPTPTVGSANGFPGLGWPCIIPKLSW